MVTDTGKTLRIGTVKPAKLIKFYHPLVHFEQANLPWR